MDHVVGVDIGGTFTDCVVVNANGIVTVGKAPSTPDDFSRGVVDALRDVAGRMGLEDERALLGSTTAFFHSCTVGENTLLTQSGAKTGLITTKGFADIILIMRGKITEGLTEAEAAHLSALSKPEPLVPRWLIEEVSERIDSTGAILVPLDTNEARMAIRHLVGRDVESIAISLIWSIANKAHERRLKELISNEHPSVYVCTSNEVAPYLGEYERTATTVINAYIAKNLSHYLSNLQKALREKGLKREPLIMQAYGGVQGIDSTRTNAVGTIESGPAAGIIGSKFLGELIGEHDILAADMGGTTFKVGVIRQGAVEREFNPVMLQYSIVSPKVWVASIGAGGGSIAWIHPESGLLKVGPYGAGASPGPVCYALGGTEPTVCDADLVLGYLNADYFLGGRMRLDRRLALKLIDERLARQLRMDPMETARSIVRIANAHMSDLIRKATVERGYDPRDFVLFAFGGAGPVHAGQYAKELGLSRIVIPFTASVHAATGLVTSDVVFQYGTSDHMVAPFDTGRVNANFTALCKQARTALESAGFASNDIEITRSVDMRYKYQVHELNVPLEDGISDLSKEDIERLCTRFGELYEIAYGRGSGYPEAGREAITFRVEAVGKMKKPHIRRQTMHSADSKGARKGARDVFFEEAGGVLPTPLYDFDSLMPGNEVLGPAIIETPVTTIVVNPGAHVQMDEIRNIVMELG